jgi:hypothetical protein
MALLAFAVAAAAACYRPNIKDGGLACSDAGTCPEGFSCSMVDNHCWSADAGPSCAATMPHVASVCSDLPAAGSVCNPACQTGCPCGRCAVVAGMAKCVDVGTKTEGSVCNPTADDCGTGFGCVKEPCSANGRCRRFCRTQPDCTGKEFCSTVFGPSVVCDAPSLVCNPLDGSGCLDPALACYIPGSGSTICECPETGTQGATPCPTPLCAPGFSCVNYMGQAACHQVCDPVNNPTCPANTVCLQGLGQGFGFCGQM